MIVKYRVLLKATILALSSGIVVGCDGDTVEPTTDDVVRNEIVFAGASSDGVFTHILRIKPDGTALRHITSGSVRDAYPRVSPDGKTVAFVRIGPTTQLHLVNADGTNLRQITFDATHKLTGLSWSPDGTKVVFGGQDKATGNWDIYVLDVSSGSIANISATIPNPSRRIYLHPDWGSSNEIIFSKNDTLYWITPGGHVLRKRAYHGWASGARWSPAGDQIVFAQIDVSVSPSRVDLALVDEVGAGFRLLTNHSAIDSDPEWSPNGDEITFRSEREGGGDIFVLRVDQPEILRNITRRPGQDSSPSWH